MNSLVDYKFTAEQNGITNETISRFPGVDVIRTLSRYLGRGACRAYRTILGRRRGRGRRGCLPRVLTTPGRPSPEVGVKQSPAANDDMWGRARLRFSAPPSLSPFLLPDPGPRLNIFWIVFDRNTCYTVIVRSALVHHQGNSVSLAIAVSLIS